MSEFFKALEQAERDRLRQDQAEAPSAQPASRTPREAGRANNTAVELPEPSAAKPAVAKAVAATPAVADPPVTKAPVPRPPVAKGSPATPASVRPTAAKTTVPPSVTPINTKAPVSTDHTPPSSVFRPSLRVAERVRFGGRHSGRQPALVTVTNPSSIEADAYRTLRANIELMADGGAFRHVAITSAGGGDGKSTTAANLAVVCAQGGRRVCLVDADLRRPTLHEVFGLPNVDGLTSALEHGKPLHTVAKPADIENLSVVVSGRGVQEDFQDLLTAQRLERILAESEAAFDLVIFDSPPVISIADALSVAAVSDGVILVVRAGSIPFSVLERAIAQVKQVKGRVLGVLLNKVDLRAADTESYRYYRAYHTTTRSKV